jgi:rhomboid protease GluP
MMLMAQIKVGGAGGLGLFSAFDPETTVRFGSGLSIPYRLSDGTVTGGEWWRIVTPIFLHGSILHFFFNSYFLLNLGPLVEDLFGTERFWVAYLTCGIAGSWASQLRPVNTVGASGALMGMIGLLLVYGLRNRSALGESMKRLVGRLAVFFVIVSLLAGGAARIDHLNHLGGFACGALLAWVLPARGHRSAVESALWQLLTLAGVLLVLFCFWRVATFAG